MASPFWMWDTFEVPVKGYGETIRYRPAGSAIKSQYGLIRR
jgi:hypothetical protein